MAENRHTSLHSGSLIPAHDRHGLVGPANRVVGRLDGQLVQALRPLPELGPARSTLSCPTAVGNNSDVTRLLTRNISSLPGRTLFSSRGRQAAKLTTSSLSLSATANPIPPDAFFTPIYSAAWPAPPALRSARQHHEACKPQPQRNP